MLLLFLLSIIGLLEETATKNVLNEFLGKYGKSADPKKEEKRLGITHKESAASIVVDYGLPLTTKGKLSFLMRSFLYISKGKL